MRDTFLNTTAPISPVPTQSSEPAVPPPKVLQNNINQHLAGPSLAAPKRGARRHVRQDRGNADGDGDGDEGDKGKKKKAKGKKKTPPDLLRTVPAERDAYSVASFCARHSISRDKFYDLLAKGLAPETVQIGTRRLITREAAAAWRMKLAEGAGKE